MRIRISSEEMTKVAGNLRRLSDKFDDIIKDINSIVKSIDWELRSSEGVDQKASSAIKSARKISSGLDSMAKDLEFARDRMIEEDEKAANTTKKMKRATIGASVAAVASAGNAKVASVNYTSDYKNLGPGTASCPNTFVGDPINVTSGNFYVTKKDIQIPSRGIVLEIKRYYNSIDQTYGILGKGWRIGYETSLMNMEDSENILVVYPDGSVNVFEYNEEDNKYTAPRGVFDILQKNEDESYTLKLHDGTTYRYDKSGSLISISDLNENKISIKYDRQGMISSAVSPGGKRLDFSYEGSRLRRITDHTGREITYSYDKSGNLIQVKYPDGGSIKYGYDNMGMISITDQNGNTYVQNTYDEAGRVVKQLDHEGNELIIEYYPEECKNIYKWQKTGITRIYKYNEEKLLTETIYDDGTKEVFTYDENNNRDSITDRNGRTKRFKYDERGNLTAEIMPEPFNYTIRYSYDENNRRTKISTPGGGLTRFEYDEKGNLLKRIVKTGSSSNSETVYTYDEFGRVLTVTDAENNTTSFEYYDDDINKPSAIIDAEGSKFAYDFDDIGRVVEITTGYGTVKIEYNQQDKVTGLIDAEKNKIRIKYDAVGNMIGVITPEQYAEKGDKGQGYTFAYDAMDRMIKQVDPLGNVFAVKYDENGNKIKEVNPNYYNEEKDDGIGIAFKYDSNHRQINTIFPDGSKSRIKYDPRGNIIKTILPSDYDESTDDGPGVQFTYDEMNRVVEIIDPDGNVINRYVYDEDSRVIKEINAKGYMSADNDEERWGTLYKYNLAGWLLERRVPLESLDGQIVYNVTENVYDRNGRIVQQKTSPEYVTKTGYPKNWNIINYKYDKNGRVIEVSDSIGSNIQYEYDCLGKKTLEKKKINDSTYKITRFEYNSAGKLKKVSEVYDGKDLAGEEKETVTADTLFEYDKNGNITAITSPEGYRKRFTYDAANRRTSVEAHLPPDGVKISGNAANALLKTTVRRTLYSYDKAGNLVRQTLPNGNTIEIEYDEMNRKIRVRDAEGNTTRLFYDVSGNLIKRVLPENYDPETDDGPGTSYLYDSMNRLLQVTNAAGVVVERNLYNTAGEIIKRIGATEYMSASDDNDRYGVEYGYDLGGRLKYIATPEAKAKGIVSQQYSYNSLGHITEFVDGKGNTTKYNLDLWGKIKEVHEASGSVSRYEYDYAGNLTSVIDGNGNTTQYNYNSLNLISGIIDPLGGKISYKYDKQGRRVWAADKEGRIIHCRYNFDNKLVSSWNEDGILEKYEYNLDGSLAASISDRTIHSYTYTPSGRLKRKNTNGVGVLDYEYDKNGRVTRLTDVSGKTVEYNYDILGRLTSVANAGRQTAQYEYNPDNTISRILYGSGVCAKYDYNMDKKIVGLLSVDPFGQELFNGKYSYDANGNQVMKEENGKATLYSYDSVNRLEKVSYPEGNNEKFDYDNAGNRLAREFGESIENYKYDQNNRLIQKVSNGIVTDYEYDVRGNLVKEIEGESVRNFEYDEFNRLTKVINPDGTYLENIYDAEGMRVQTIENGEYRRFIFDGKQIISEVGEDWELKSRNIRGHALLELEDENNNAYHYLHNVHGDVTNLTDSSGKIINSYDYDAFGNTVKEKETVRNRFRYAGEQYDDLTGQYYLRARYYNPAIGRFTQEDTWRGFTYNPASLNLYTYVENNPVMYIDPTGHWPKFIDKAVDWVGDKVSDAADWVGDKVSDAADWVGDRVSDAVDWVGDRVEDVGNFITDTASNVKDWWVENNVGAYVVGGLKIIGGIAIGVGAVALTVATFGAAAPLVGIAIGAGVGLAATYVTDVVSNFAENDWKWSLSNFVPSSSPGTYIANIFSGAVSGLIPGGIGFLGNVGLIIGDSVLTTSISTLIDSGIQDIRTGEINGIDWGQVGGDFLGNVIGNTIGCIIGNLIPDVHVPESRQVARNILRNQGRDYSGPAARAFIKKRLFQSKIVEVISAFVDKVSGGIASEFIGGDSKCTAN